jgi:hypothetical protein
VAAIYCCSILIRCNYRPSAIEDKLNLGHLGRLRV